MEVKGPLFWKSPVTRMKTMKMNDKKIDLNLNQNIEQ